MSTLFILAGRLNRRGLTSDTGKWASTQYPTLESSLVPVCLLETESERKDTVFLLVVVISTLGRGARPLFLGFSSVCVVRWDLCDMYLADEYFGLANVFLGPGVLRTLRSLAVGTFAVPRRLTGD